MDQGPSKFPYTVLSPLHTYLIDDCVKAFIIGNKTKAMDVMSRFSTVNADIVLLFPKWYLYKLSNHVSYLHLAAYNGWLDVIEELILNHHFKLSSEVYNIHPLHYACAGGHIDCVKYFIHKHGCLPNIGDEFGLQPIHVACSMGNINVIKFFIEELKIDPLVNTTNYFIPFHYACLSGNVLLMGYLLSKIPPQKTHSALNFTNYASQAPIHFACSSYSINPVQFLVLTQSVDLMAKDMYGFTPLHTACSTGCTSIVEYLLSLQSVDPSATDYRKRTPVEVVPLMHNNELKILKLFANTRAIPYLNNYTKVFFCGHPRNGKSSLATVIDTRSKIPSNFLKEVFTLSKLVDGVPEFTEGIVPYNIQSSEVGNLILYDFAGDHEYYSSHIAVLHKLRLPGIFVIFINLLKDILDIYDELCFWLNFVNNFKSNAGMSKLIVVGSHADKVVTKKEELFQSVEKLIKNGIDLLPVHNFHFISFVPLDCRCLKDKSTDYFIKSLSSASEAVLEKSDTITFDCLIVYTILRQKTENFIALGTIIADCNHLELNVNVIDTIHKLHDKGLIFFFEGLDPSRSYVIVHAEKLLHDINGKLFAHPSDLQLAPSNIGLIPLSILCKSFPDIDPNVLAFLLTSLGFCYTIDPSTCNIFTKSAHNAEDVLFFPSLIQKEIALTDIDPFDNSLCWCLWCTDAVFPNFFLHTILLRFSHSFCSPKSNIGRRGPCLQHYKTLNRKCIVWKNGIYWKTTSCVNVYIEMSEMNRRITLFVSNNDKRTEAHSLNLRSQLVNSILSIQKEICPSCNVEECCVYPQPFNAVLSTNLSELKFCTIIEIAQAVVNKYPKISSDTLQDCDTITLIGNDPYCHLSQRSIQHLFTCTSGDLPNYILKELRDLPLITFKSYANLEVIRDTLNKHSIFCGRNPLEMIPDIERQIFNYSNEIDLVTALEMTKDLHYRWDILGIYLAGISQSDINVIKQNNQGDCVTCCSKMLSVWIDKQKQKATVEALQEAIKFTNNLC